MIAKVCLAELPVLVRKPVDHNAKHISLVKGNMKDVAKTERAKNVQDVPLKGNPRVPSDNTNIGQSIVCIMIITNQYI